MDQGSGQTRALGDLPEDPAQVPFNIPLSYMNDEEYQSNTVEFGNGAARNRIFKQQQIQQETRLRIRHQKLHYTIIGYVVVMVFLAVLQFIGVGFFTLGFLLSRPVLPNIAECTDTTCVPAKYDKAIILIIDALRFDFAIPVEGSKEPFHNHFPILYDLANGDNGLLLKFMADPPTTTLQRLKGLTTGSLPTFIDAGSNFDGTAIEEDNWLLQLHKRNKSIAFMGDDTWTALFTEFLNPELCYPYDSLNVWDLHTVDNGVIEHLFPLLEKANSTKWDLMVGHFLGADHVGHRYGPSHHSMKAKLNQMNKVVEDVVAKMDDKTLLLVMGDHGMDPTGNHGGDSPEELESTLFMYSKKKHLFRKKTAEYYNIENLGKDYRSVNQIDLVPTISLLLGLPVPYNNLGSPIEEAFTSDSELSTANYITLMQAQTFRKHIPNLSPEIDARYESLVASFKKGDKEVFIRESSTHQLVSLEEFKQKWARFDLKLISIGIVILISSLTFVLTYARSIPSIRVLTMSFEFINSVTPMILLGVVLSFSVYIVLKPNDFNLKKCLFIGTAIGITVGFWAPIMDRFSLNWLIHQVHDFFVYNFNSWSFLALVFVSFHSLIFASNSFVIWEDQMVSFFLITFGFCCIYGCLVNTKITRAQRIMGVLHAVTFTLLARLTSMIQLCREEQRPYCKPTFATSGWSIVVLNLIAFILPEIIKSFYKLSDSYHSAAPLWIGTGFKFVLLMNAGHWTLEYLQNSEYFLELGLQPNATLGKSFKLAIARIVLTFTLVIANYCWSRGPLCLKLDIEEKSDSSTPPKKATILGCANAYGSLYFFLVLNFAAAVLLTNKPMGAISLSMLLVQILSLLELYDLLDIRRNLIAPVIFGLLAFQHFFSTGHQATIQSIQWDIGFLTTELIVFPFTHINIVLNTFGSFIIMCLSIPLISMWKIQPSNKPITVLAQIVTDMTTFLTYNLFTSTLSLIFAAHFRRHLMVWKIFAPRFMLSGMLIIVINIMFVFFTLWFGSSKVVSRIYRIFK